MAAANPSPSTTAGGEAGAGECPVCLRMLTDPQALQCLHFYCKQCVNKLEPATDENEQSGHKCLLCRKFTPRNNIRSITFVRELLETINFSDYEKSCDTCNAELPTWRCMECREDFCDVCRDYHDRFSLFRNHVTSAISNVTPRMSERHVFCEIHPREMIKLHCKDCQLLICMLCNGTRHKNHQAETIDEAINGIKPTLLHMRNQVENLLQQCQEALVKAQEHGQTVKQQYEQLEHDIDQHFDDVIARVRKDCAELQRELNERKSKQLRTIQKQIGDLQADMKARADILHAYDVMFEQKQGINLLSDIQAGFQSRLSLLARDLNLPKLPDTDVRFTAAVVSHNCVGTLVSSVEMNSCRLSVRLEDISSAHSELVNQVHNGFECIHFAHIQDKLWFIEDSTNNIHVTYMDAKPLVTFSPDNTGFCQSICALNNIVLLAAQRGLFTFRLESIDVLLTATDRTRTCNTRHALELTHVMPGDVCDVSVSLNNVVALCNQTCNITLLKFANASRQSLTTLNEIPIYGYTKHVWNSIQLTEDYIYVGIAPDDTILQYHRTGQLYRTFSMTGETLGKLLFPIISGADREDNVLIADRNNNRLLTLSRYGEWDCIDIDDLGDYPSCIAINEGTLYVGCWFKKLHIHKMYSILSEYEV